MRVRRNAPDLLSPRHDGIPVYLWKPTAGSSPSDWLCFARPPGDMLCPCKMEAEPADDPNSQLEGGASAERGLATGQEKIDRV